MKTTSLFTSLTLASTWPVSLTAPTQRASVNGYATVASSLLIAMVAVCTRLNSATNALKSA
jgi:hypothetical protein